MNKLKKVLTLLTALTLTAGLSGVSEVCKGVAPVGIMNACADEENTNSNDPSENQPNNEEKADVEMEGYNISIGNEIVLNFHAHVKSEKADGAYVLFTVPDTTKEQVKVMLGSPYKDDLYKVPCPVAAKEMRGTVKADFYDVNDKLLLSDEYSVYQSAEDIIKNKDSKPSYTACQPFVKAMLNYGAAAQKYFKFDEDNLANDMTDSDGNSIADDYDDVTATTLTDYNFGSQKCSFATLAGSTVTFISKTKICVAFKTKAEDLTFTCDGKELTPYKNGSYTVVDIENISAKELGKIFTITATSGGSSYDFKAGVFSYGYNALSKDSVSNDLKATMKALYKYYLAATEYTPVEDSAPTEPENTTEDPTSAPEENNSGESNE